MLCGVLIEDYEWSSLVKIGYITVTCGLTPGLYILGMRSETLREEQSGAQATKATKATQVSGEQSKD